MDENRFWILAAKKLSGELNSEEKSELELLFVSDPSYKKIFTSLEQRLATDDNAGSRNSEEKILENLRIKLSIADPEHFTYPASAPELFVADSVGNSRRTGRTILLLSSVFLLLVIALSSKFLFDNAAKTTNKLPFLGNNISTKPGSKSQVTLPDGTIVILNSDSKLTYPDNFLGATRDVTLEGEAFFEVTENKAKPFIIHSTTMDIKVLGTVFNVKAYPDETNSEAALIKGSIEVTLKNRRNEKIMLKPSEKITVSNTGRSESRKAESISPTSRQADDNSLLVSLNKINYDKVDSLVNEIAWTQNKLVFNNERFDNIIVLLQRWYNKKIEIRTESLKELHFTGKFNNETIDQVLKALQLSHKFNYKRENDIIVIY